MNVKMKLFVTLAGLAVIRVLASQPEAASAPAAPEGPGPRIAFANSVLDFDKIQAGDSVKHSFVFTNIGDQSLEITQVQPSCGCTTAGEWSRRVAPGETGSIPIQFNSANFNGQVLKTITVQCNDRTHPVVTLQLKGIIWKPIELVPAFAVLNVPPDAGFATTTVRITNHTEQPLTLEAPQVNNPAFTAELSSTVPGKEFQLVIATTPPLKPGTVQGQVSIRTSSTNTPLLSVPFWANVQPAVVILPPQVSLPMAPLQNQISPSFTVQNNSTNPLSVTEGSLNIPGVEVKMQEMNPGRTYSVNLTFPAGFELPQDRAVQFTAKTSNPHYPEIAVPVTQPPRQRLPAATAPVPPPPPPIPH